MISYAPLWATMKKRKVTTYALVEKHGISSATMSKIRRGGYLSLRTVEDLCLILKCRIQDVVVISQEPAKKETPPAAAGSAPE